LSTSKSHLGEKKGRVRRREEREGGKGRGKGGREGRGEEGEGDLLGDLVLVQLRDVLDREAAARALVHLRREGKEEKRSGQYILVPDKGTEARQNTLRKVAEPPRTSSDQASNLKLETSIHDSGFRLSSTLRISSLNESSSQCIASLLRPAYLVRGDEGDGRPGTPEATHTADTLHVPVDRKGRGEKG
jgi:hypothetical protein